MKKGFIKCYIEIISLIRIKFINSLEDDPITSGGRQSTLVQAISGTLLKQSHVDYNSSKSMQSGVPKGNKF